MIATHKQPVLYSLVWVTMGVLFLFGTAFAQIVIDECSDITGLPDLSTGYVLTQDLDCSAEGNNIMIGSFVTPFSGTFDGGGYTITVDIDSNEQYVGLFRRTVGANIYDLSLSGSVSSSFSDFDNSVYLGGLVGFAQNSTILSGVHVTANIVGSGDNIGGLVGFIVGGSIIGSSVENTIIGTGNIAYRVGGLAGYAYTTVIQRSYALGNIQGYAEVGGLVGAQLDSSISLSYANMDVSATYLSVGGLVGIAGSNSSVMDSYAMGDVAGAGERIGGLIGYIGSSYILRAYSVGTVTGSSDVGGLVGNDAGLNSLTSSFRDTESSNMATDGLGATGLPTAQMQDIDTFSGAGWDFEEIWSIDGINNGGYPYLQWQNMNTDTLTEIPTLISPIEGSTHVRTAQMDISFSIPEAASSNSIQLLFIPEDLSGGTVSLTLADVVPTIEQQVSLYPEDILTLPWVVSTNASDIPNGSYTVVLSYQDVFGNPAANVIVNNVTIMDAPTPYVLTQVTQVPSMISSNTALYVFSSAGTGLADPVATPCGRSSHITVSENVLNTTIELEISGLEVGKTYACQIALKSLGDIYSNRLQIGPFTVRSSGGGGGGSVSADYCPYGDTSGSYYDGNCGPEKNLIEKIVATLISRWAGRSPERIQATLATLSFLNDKVQATQSVSEDMKSLFAGIVTMLTTHFQQ